VNERSAAKRIRQATLADIEIILHHRRSMFADMGEGGEAELDEMVISARPFIEAAIRNGSYRGWLIEVGDRVVSGGGVAIVGYQPTPLDSLPRRAYVLNVYTEPAYRRQGLARQVLQTIIAWCRERGFKAVLLHASDAGRPLYQELGFAPTNEMRLLLT
jgi:GNAT superfamily N-acetyltransferase